MKKMYKILLSIATILVCGVAYDIYSNDNVGTRSYSTATDKDWINSFVDFVTFSKNETFSPNNSFNEQLNKNHQNQKPSLHTKKEENQRMDVQQSVTSEMVGSTIGLEETDELFSELDKKWQQSDKGWLIISLDDIKNENEKLYQLQMIEGLRLYGSLSGGKLTHEFEGLKHKRKVDIKNTDFEPTDLSAYFANTNLTMTGRTYGGAINDGKYNEIFYLYENGNQKIEYSEHYLNPKNNTVIEVVKETLNETIKGVPLTFETVTENGKDTEKNGTYYNAQFGVNGRYFSVSSHNIGKAEMINLVSEIIDKNTPKPIQ